MHCNFLFRWQENLFHLSKGQGIFFLCRCLTVFHLKKKKKSALGLFGPGSFGSLGPLHLSSVKKSFVKEWNFKCFEIWFLLNVFVVTNILIVIVSYVWTSTSIPSTSSWSWFSWSSCSNYHHIICYSGGDLINVWLTRSVFHSSIGLDVTLCRDSIHCPFESGLSPLTVVLLEAGIKVWCNWWITWPPNPSRTIQ